jgi:hypothetical protein
MQNEEDEHKFLIPVSKVNKHPASRTAVSNSSPQTSTRKGMLKFTGWVTTSYKTSKRYKNWPQP